MFTRQALNYALAGNTSVRHSSGKLKELGIRIKSVTNIQKITKTMNMISSAKYAKAAKELNSARSFGAAGAGAVKALTENADAPAGSKVIILASSDRGLCGALHTNLARAAHQARLAHGGDAKYVVLGDKARITLKSLGEEQHCLITAKEICRNPPTFADTSAVAEELLNSDYNWASGTIFYNFHKSAMTQEIKEMPVSSEQGLIDSDGITLYDSVDEDVLKNYSEFALATTLYGAVKENYISEQAARMISMDGAAKNAGEMIDKMTLSFNRLRQAVITTELCEIIAGMAAL
jgi:F-type H+-transporting ATPase subunit gamma